MSRAREGACGCGRTLLMSSPPASSTVQSVVRYFIGLALVAAAPSDAIKRIAKRFIGLRLGARASVGIIESSSVVGGGAGKARCCSRS